MPCTFIGLYSSIYHFQIDELADIYFHVGLGYLSWVIYLCSALCTLKPKKTYKKPKKPKNLKKSKNPRFFPALRRHRHHHRMSKRRRTSRDFAAADELLSSYHCGGDKYAVLPNSIVTAEAYKFVTHLKSQG